MKDIIIANQPVKPGLVEWKTETNESDTIHPVLVNASAMAVPFRKKVSDWLRLSSTRRLLSCLSEMKGIPVSSLVKKSKRSKGEGLGKGIWMHEEAALEFARWLSPSFAIWNNRRTKELLLTGRTEAVQNEASWTGGVTDMLLHKVTEIDEVIHDQARKAGYHDTVLQSRTLIPATVIAKELGMSAIALNRLLHEKKIIYKSNDQWVLYADYAGKGYTGTKTALYIDSAGKYGSNIHTYWTEKGREFIHELVKEKRQIA